MKNHHQFDTIILSLFKKKKKAHLTFSKPFRENKNENENERIMCGSRPFALPTQGLMVKMYF